METKSPSAAARLLDLLQESKTSAPRKCWRSGDAVEGQAKHPEDVGSRCRANVQCFRSWSREIGRWELQGSGKGKLEAKVSAWAGHRDIDRVSIVSLRCKSLKLCKDTIRAPERHPCLPTVQTILTISHSALRHRSNLTLLSIPLRLAAHILDLLQLAPHLHHTIPNHARVQAQRPPHRMLRLGARVEAQDEVVALAVDGALLARRLGQQEGAPVGDAAHDAAGGEDDVAGRFGDFFDLGDAAVWADLVLYLLAVVRVCQDIRVERTTPISS